MCTVVNVAMGFLTHGRRAASTSVYLLLGCLLNTFSQRLPLHRFANASHCPSFTVLYTQTQVLELGDIVLTQSFILLSCAAAYVSIWYSIYKEAIYLAKCATGGNHLYKE